MDFTIRIANTNILIHSVYSRIFNLCKDYQIDCNSKPDLELYMNYEMISAEFVKMQQSGDETTSFGVVESLLIHRAIAEALLESNTLLMHGAVIALNNSSYLFSGRSGTGKTTHIRKWLEGAKDSFVVNGDKPFVIIGPEGVFSCGTPWCGKEHMGSNTIVPLKSIIFMERSIDNYIVAEPFKAVVPRLLEQTYKPMDVNKMKKTLNLLGELKDHVSFYTFYFNNFKADAFHTSFDELTKNINA